MTVNVPSALAAQVPSDAMDWLVPGLYKEKLAMLIKSLPKAYRKKVVPVKDTVEIIAREMKHKQGALVSVLGNFIYRRFGVDIPASAWPLDALPDYLKMRISVIAPDGSVISAGRRSENRRRSVPRASRITPSKSPGQAHNWHRGLWSVSGRLEGVQC